MVKFFKARKKKDYL